MVQYITYKNEKYPIKIGYKVLKQLKAENVELEKAMGQNGQIDYEIFEPVLFYSLQQGHHYMDIPMPFKREEMEDLLDDCLFEFIELIPTFFQSPQKGVKRGTEILKKSK